jgi:hypothetical protein
MLVSYLPATWLLALLLGGGNQYVGPQHSNSKQEEAMGACAWELRAIRAIRAIRIFGSLSSRPSMAGSSQQGSLLLVLVVPWHFFITGR